MFYGIVRQHPLLDLSEPDGTNDLLSGPPRTDISGYLGRTSSESSLEIFGQVTRFVVILRPKAHGRNLEPAESREQNQKSTHMLPIWSGT